MARTGDSFPAGRQCGWLPPAPGDVLAGMLGRHARTTGDMLADDPALVPEVAAAAAYLHGLAAAAESQSDQRGWHRPRIYGHHHHHFGTIEHPIVASDIIDGIRTAFMEQAQ